MPFKIGAIFQPSIFYHSNTNQFGYCSQIFSTYLGLTKPKLTIFKLFLIKFRILYHQGCKLMLTHTLKDFSTFLLLYFFVFPHFNFFCNTLRDFWENLFSFQAKDVKRLSKKCKKLFLCYLVLTNNIQLRLKNQTRVTEGIPIFVRSKPFSVISCMKSTKTV